MEGDQVDGATDMTVKSLVNQFLNDERVSEARYVGADLEFVPKGFEKAIKVRVYQHSEIGEMQYYFETSRHTCTPLQAGPFVADPWERTAGAAANRAVEGILSYIEEAKSKGFFAHDGWLVENALWE